MTGQVGVPKSMVTDGAAAAVEDAGSDGGIEDIRPGDEEAAVGLGGDGRTELPGSGRLVDLQLVADGDTAGIESAHLERR